MQQYPDALFVVCGQQDPQIMDMINTRLQTLGVTDHAIFPGRITKQKKFVTCRRARYIYSRPCTKALVLP